LITPTHQDAGLIERARKASRFGKISQDHALLLAALADRLEALSQAANAPQGEAVAWRDAVGAVFDAGMCFGGRKDRGANEYLEVRKNAVDIVMLAASPTVEEVQHWRWTSV
jgi:hypothetical protein